jgi:hypothetical protein
MPTHNKNKPRTPRELTERPVWSAAERELYWRGRLLLRPAVQAHAERAILDKFEECEWRFVVKNPLPRDELGDKTASRRNAICNLMRRQGDRPGIQFFSALDGFIAWCPAEWLTE